ncbi:DUF4129 domain-containing protein [Glycomyces buryatensis]|uniref:DUF4129 domain-containing protein n=1 Tax=Glycomyces buryatensis TaxID=2570927 RepID=UPI0014562976|nr:DUF4129 domain-containing protein [Glycomyces buryatensis]
MLRSRRWLPVIGVVLALFVVGIAAQGTGVQWGRAEVNLEFEGQSPPPPPPPESEFELPSETPTAPVEPRGSLPGWVTWLVLGIIVGIPLTLFLIWLGRKLSQWLIDARPTDEPAPATEYRHRDVSLVEQAVAAGLAEIDLGEDVRSAIIACWVHFERAAAAVGIEKESSDTPADLVRHLLERHELDGAALARLSEAYLKARYSPHEVGETDREAARSALVELRTQLGVAEAR